MYEYKVVPAPQRAVKAKGLKTTAERFAHMLAEHINAEAAGGWQFVRTESLPCEERSTLGSTRLSQQVVMIFARERAASRPDAGAALAAAQGTGAGPALRLPAAPERAEPRPELRAAPRPEPRAEARAEAPAAEDEAPARRRQEPLFRSGAMLRAESGNRAEPVLRPRTSDTGDGES